MFYLDYIGVYSYICTSIRDEQTGCKNLTEMKKQELMKAINSGDVIYTTASEFLKSSITWFEDNIEPSEYMVEICRPDHIDNIQVTFSKNEEFAAKCYNTDFSEVIKSEDEESFLKELCENAEIFAERN